MMPVMIDPNSEVAQPLSFCLKEIASWMPGVCTDIETEIRASIPALQRGLVWSPQQNELLWDSILRGFPIGAVVLTKWSDKLKKTDEAIDRHITHHLLDGQQRCNAIAMGFSDPFGNGGPPDEKKVESILWLDLNPTLEGNSTRHFLVRATTTAHPWGYRKDDGATPLTAVAIRKALEPFGLYVEDPKYQRPSPMELWPCKDAAEIPVPLSWLLQLPLEDEGVFWRLLGQRAGESGRYRWAENVHEFCVSPEAEEGKHRIFKGLKRVYSARLIALEAPEELLEVSDREKIVGSDREDVCNIEQLFQRLNRQGTKLDGEELAYSMIKAYWPDLEKPINEVSECRMPQSRMVSLGVRAALAKADNRNLPGSLTVSALRGIARTEIAKKELIQNFITQDLRRACEIVDHWLKYETATNPSGLLPVHITSIAIGSRDVYLLLLHFATRLSGRETAKSWKKTMQALATILHWFSVDKAKVVNLVYAYCHDDVSIEHIRSALKDSSDSKYLHRIHTPAAVQAFVQIAETKLKDWNWDRLIYGDGKSEGWETRLREWHGFLGFRNNRELLLYAQRDFLAKRFRDYDPARKDLWEAHNRPWDFDHILASYYFYNRKDGSDYRGLCGQWGYTIGNLRAWPFEDNRSDQADSAAKKIKDDWENSFLEPDEVHAFSEGDQIRSNEDNARLFAETCRKRLLRIYSTWYDSLAIDQLIEITNTVECEV